MSKNLCQSAFRDVLGEETFVASLKTVFLVRFQIVFPLFWRFFPEVIGFGEYKTKSIGDHQIFLFKKTDLFERSAFFVMITYE
ncbi:hypothetical protein BSK20_04830 [SR1 bacterium human oral taxon HOT-345]|nr:hypothetical protein BSK20_05015 [SR1 bacterium human oral taxon HOT-345]RAL55650.1 hypothetical protein BSK20_04830 [SR1 bacterium human oral taxon HOT-345]